MEGPATPSKERSLTHRLRHAVKAGWLRPDDFSAIRNRRHEYEFQAEAMHNSGLPIEIPAPDESLAGQAAALDALVENARDLRNLHAHPDFLILMMPNWAFGHPVFTKELVDSLFRKRLAPPA